MDQGRSPTSRVLQGGQRRWSSHLMPEQRGSIEIGVSREAVWEIVSDPSRLGDWTTIHRGFEGEVPSRVEEGTTFTQELEVAGQEFSVEWTATEVEEPSRMV